MKTGDTVTIYEDPITCHIEEGKAMLVEKIRREKCDYFNGKYLLEHWTVRFTSDNFQCNRKIKVSIIKEL